MLRALTYYFLEKSYFIQKGIIYQSHTLWKKCEISFQTVMNEVFENQQGCDKTQTPDRIAVVQRKRKLLLRGPNLVT